MHGEELQEGSRNILSTNCAIPEMESKTACMHSSAHFTEVYCASLTVTNSKEGIGPW